MRWPGGLKLWRVTGGDVDLGGKEPYDPGGRARSAPGEHAEHFAGLLGGDRRRSSGSSATVSSSRRSIPSCSGTGGSRDPTGSASVYRALARDDRGVRPVTASRHLADHPARQPIRLAFGLVGRQRRFQHVAQRPRRSGPGSGSGRWRKRSGTRRPRRWPIPPRGRCSPRRRASCSWPSRPTGSSSSPPAPRRTTPSGASREHCDDAEALLAALAPGGEDRLAARPDAGPKSWPGATISSLTSSPPSPRRSAAPAPWSYADRWTRSASSSDCTSTSRSATSTTSSPSTWRTSTGRCSTGCAGRGFLPGRPASLRAAARVAGAARARLSRSAGPLAADGKIEMLLSGLYEPVLASLPRADRVEQIRWMHEAVRRRFGVDASGLWLTERVWEPELAADLADAGVALRAGGRPPLPGHRLRERAAARALLDRERRAAGGAVPDRRAAPLPDPLPPAGGDGALPPRAARRRAPARGAGRRRREVRRLARHQGVGLRAWLARPVHGRPSARWWRAARCGSSRLDEALAEVPSNGLAYLPTASYTEMEGWSLPPDAALRLAPSAARHGRGARRGSRRRAGPGRALAELPRQVLRVEPDAQEDAGALRALPPQGESRRRPAAPSAGPSATTPTGTACSAGSTSRTSATPSGASWRWPRASCAGARGWRGRCSTSTATGTRRSGSTPSSSPRS